MCAVASSSSSSTALPEKKYDVFISFGGEDTRRGFISHLRAHLLRENIEVYVDETIEKGDEISDALSQAIQDSHISVVVFSKNYASSKWCLNELNKILECKNLDGQIVIPVFYEIDPSHVRNQTGSYMEAFTKHKQELKDEEKLRKWKASLSEAANLAGWDSRNYRDQYILIEKIVKDILHKLDDSYPCELQDVVVGIDESVEHVTALLSKFPIVGIWGMGGIGKTTLCKAIFANLSSQYEGCCFLENVTEESEKHGPNSLHRKLLNELLKREENHLIGENQIFGSTFDNRRLWKKKVLIVLDDVTTTEQVKCLVRGYLCLKPSSRIIITSRDKHLLTSLRVHGIYKVKKLNNPESLKLFCLNAFDKCYPDMGFELLSEKVLAYAKGVPLALKVLGSYLHSKTYEEWESAMVKLKEFPDKDIVRVLKLSYDGLNYEEKQIFLDIACFLNGEPKAFVIDFLNSCNFYGAIGIRTLLDKALIIISTSNKVMMHDLIKETGREIVREESMKKPEKRSRLWNFEEVYDVLRNNKIRKNPELLKGTNAIEGIILDVSQIRDLHLSADTFKKMPNLRFLRLYSSDDQYWKSSEVYLHGNIDSFSDKLRYFKWHGYPSQSLPSTFCAEKLVEFNMSNSHIRKLWDGVQDLVNLKKIYIEECTQLMELPDFSKASSIHFVRLYDCPNLRHIHPSILSRPTLEFLIIRLCKKLASLQIKLRSLKHLCLVGCSSLKELSLPSEAIPIIDIGWTEYEMLHLSTGRCSNITVCLWDSVKKIPTNFSKLTYVEALRFEGSDIETLNLYIVLGRLPSLSRLQLSRCFNLCQLPDNVKYLSCLTSLVIVDSKNLLHIPGLPPSLVTLNIKNCTSLETIITPTLSQCSIDRCFLINCVKLEEHSLSGMMGLAYLRIKQAALCLDGHKPLWSKFFLPGNRVPSWFRHQTGKNCISIEIPPCSHLLGFAFCCIISAEFPSEFASLSRCGYRCYLEGSQLLKDLKGDYMSDRLWKTLRAPGMISDHVYMWYIQSECDALIEAMKVERAKGQGTKKLCFEFYVSGAAEMDVGAENVIKECGVFPIYVSEYDNYINELESSRIGSSASDDEDEDICTQKARQDVAEINSSCLLNRFGDLDNAITKESGLSDKSKRCQDKDENHQLQRKKFKRCQDFYELSGGASTSGIGVGCSQFDQVNYYELQPLTHTNTRNEFAFQPPPTDISMQNAWLDSTQMNSTCLLDQANSQCTAFN